MSIFKEVMKKTRDLRFCGIDPDVLHSKTDAIDMQSYHETLEDICDEVKILKKLYDAMQIAPKGITFETDAMLGTISKYVGETLERRVKPYMDAWVREGLLTEAQKAAIKADFDVSWEKMMLNFY